MTSPSGSQPLVIAHRGASAARPENTVAAFREARDLGADWVELDVRRTADGQLVVHHDRRLGDGRAIDESAGADLPKTVATLDDALDACAGMGVNVEIKHDRGDRDRAVALATTRRLVERVEERRPSDGGHGFDRLLVSSFDRATIDLVHRIEPGLRTAALGHRVVRLNRWLAEIAAGGHVAVNPWDPLVTAELVNRAHEQGLLVYVWTVDDPERMVQLADLGVDGIITNVPDVARRVIDGDRP
jgi:glycerophosphoryl diester phosphodiesterase